LQFVGVLTWPGAGPACHPRNLLLASFTTALVTFGTAAAIASALALRLFATETALPG
jgi:hypothetical protein